jgi:putative membrane protein
LFWLLIIVGVVLVVTSLLRRGEPPTPAGGESAQDILKRRLAKGEITLEEYERLKKELA